MDYTPKAVASLKKQEIIEEYERLLEAFREQAAAREEAERRAGQLDRQRDAQALDEGLSTTVESVLDGISRLRTLVNTTLADLGDTMTDQAEKAEKLNRAIRLQETRLQELRDIDVAADTMAKLAGAYEEERRRLEQTYQQRMHDLEDQAERRRTELDHQIEHTRALWEREAEESRRTREQEEEEYRYERDRTRRQEQQAYEDKKAALDRELQELRDTAEQDIARREADIQAREHELAELRAEVDAFPERLEDAVRRARHEVQTELERQVEHERALAQVERDWERKSFDQSIAHLENVNRALENKVQELSEDLRETRKQLNAIAERAVEGVSLAKSLGENPRSGDRPRDA